MCSICTLLPWSHWVVRHLLIVFLDFIEHKVPQIMSTDWMLQKMTKPFWVCVSVWNNLWISSFYWVTTLERASVASALSSVFPGLRCAGLAPMWAAHLCRRAAPAPAFTRCVGGSCSISLSTVPCLLPAKIHPMDFTPVCVSFVDTYFSLLWKLLCLQPVVKGGASSVFRFLPRAEDSQVSSTRSVCGALDTASSKLTNKLDT